MVDKIENNTTVEKTPEQKRDHKRRKFRLKRLDKDKQYTYKIVSNSVSGVVGGDVLLQNVKAVFSTYSKSDENLNDLFLKSVLFLIALVLLDILLDIKSSSDENRIYGFIIDSVLIAGGIVFIPFGCYKSINKGKNKFELKKNNLNPENAEYEGGKQKYAENEGEESAENEDEKNSESEVEENAEKVKSRQRSQQKAQGNCVIDTYDKLSSASELSESE
ncbi:10361_t:CDS:2 [Funneliformis mosseae]|uniref:10361_t:CDS:1 n=1 Tax=Funneliformis mosseae TaxID=27381 RepID=A0A9N9A5D7_FUNMO|nr:10361_t:CDS:2 [Funneliformis mosseae]